MGNFYLDNDDIPFYFDVMDMRGLAEIQEEYAQNGDADYVPQDLDDCVDSYRRVLEIVGQISAETLAKNAEQVDEEGNTLNADGTVTLHPLVRENLDRMAQADLMGFTLPRRYGGLNCPTLIYTMATEIVSRGDVSFMNMFGLQGIAETINAFASQEIKDETLSRFSSGEVTGAMVLTEPDAGSDLQAVRLRADYDEVTGQWYLNGVKRFITNGCGEILLTLARSEHEIEDGRGLSLFISERNECVKVRHLEHKLGIHGSPTCELVFTNCPAKLIGDRQRGLITYVMALMNGARLGIAAQSLGVAEAAFRLARTYAHSRCQFGGPIENLPPVAELLTDSRVSIEAARALAYETAAVCDRENNALRLTETVAELPKERSKELKQLTRQLKRLNAMLTPMSKYYASEMCNKVAYDAIQVLGGSGYMKDYAAERYARDARITNIYEGTSQLQVVAAIKGITSGVFQSYVEEMEKRTFDDAELETCKAQLVAAREKVAEAVAFVKAASVTYTDLSARRLVDMAVSVIIGHFLLKQAAICGRKKTVLQYFLAREMPMVEKNRQQILAGNQLAVDAYLEIVGEVPMAE
ncbi:MAG: acyl-CoA dehydrogenase family protein [Planctomycetia bacterium]|nr:acyl-CoA dehydrogenase family protein [Planctomycetia bacterium]